MSASGRRVLLSGGTSEAGWAAARALRAAGAEVVVAGRSAAKLEAFADAGFAVAAADLSDEAAVRAMAAHVGAVDGILHLVGGWRGGGGIPGQTDDDWRALEPSLASWRHVSRAFWDGLTSSPAARAAVVSSTSVARPLAGSAAYSAIKAALEAWTLALGHGLRAHARDAGEQETGAAAIFRVKELAGLEESLAAGFVSLWDKPAPAVNERIVVLSPDGPANTSAG